MVINNHVVKENVIPLTVKSLNVIITVNYGKGGFRLYTPDKVYKVVP